MKRYERPHVPEEELHAYADNQLSGGQRAEIAEHMMGCLICRAQYAEVRELRIRATEILSIAVPKIPAALQANGPEAAKSHRGKTGRRAIVAAALAVTAVGSWMLPASTKASARALLADVIAAPALLASPPSARITGVSTRGADIATDFTTATGWLPLAWEEALRRAGGRSAHLDGLPVTAARLATSGTAPALLVRQRLPDGRAVWVIEGSRQDVADASARLEASGLTLTDPVTTAGRTVRIAANLGADSLTTLQQRLTR